MSANNTTSRVFQIPADYQSFDTDNLILALEGLIYYPDNYSYVNQYDNDKYNQKRFLICEHAQSLINKVKDLYNLSSDKSAICLAISSFYYYKK
tara:strand:+ start:27683 stop:27964 length:282 start_codon:yes stop_codon:yes gene_type:complete